MDAKHIIQIEMTPDQLSSLIQQAVESNMEDMSTRIQGLESALKSERPAFDREMAAWYCHKSVDWIDRRRRSDNLPSHKVGGTPHFYRKDLDHMLKGGTFSSAGTPIKPISKAAGE